MARVRNQDILSVGFTSSLLLKSLAHVHANLPILEGLSDVDS